MKMVSHAKLQYYRHNYCLVCMTGLLGCRWHRYKQSTRDSRKRDLFVFTVMLMTFFFVSFVLYFAIIADNDFDDLNWYFYVETGRWIPVYTIFLTIICVIFIYFVLLSILYLCHIFHGHQLYTHLVHIVIILISLGFLIGITITIEELWHSEWSVIWLSLKITGPFLQIGAVCIMTALSWVIARQWYTLSSTGVQLLWLVFFITAMVGLYLSPLFINSPCVISISDLPPRPKVIAHRGASGIAPENTLASFQIANEYDVYGFETDIQISYDGVPFLLHDKTLYRTTNIDTVFPDMAKYYASSFNMSQIKKLNAGKWFVDYDPMGTVSGLSESQKKLNQNQSVPTLQELIKLVNDTGKYLMFNLKDIPERHPYYNHSKDLIIDILKASGVQSQKIIWLTGLYNNTSYENFTITMQQYYPVELLRKHNVSHVNLMYSDLSEASIREYQDANITTIIYTINTKWFYSLYWCMGVDAVVTNNCHILQNMESPVWHLSPRNYLILWITVDVMSALIVITAFIVQRIWWSGANYNPERLSINSNEHGTQTRKALSRTTAHRHSKRQMKQKLILRDVADVYEDEGGIEEDYGIESNYTVQSTDGRELVQSFRAHTSYQDGVIMELDKVDL